MNRRARFLTVLSGAWALGITFAQAQFAHGGTTPYALAEESTMEAGCFAPCKCPVLIRGPLKGTFLLTPTGADPLFNNYAVTDVDWAVPFSNPELRVRGSGRYRVGGEFAIQHQLSLDLTVGEQPPQHFDSGLVPGGSDFPKINISISAHQAFCFDTVFNVHAAPARPAAVGDEGGRSGSPTVSPNPFLEQAHVTFGLHQRGPVDLVVYDLLGREVRTVARRQWLGQGVHSLTWDGHANDGGEPAAGIYFVRLTAEGRDTILPVVRLR